MKKLTLLFASLGIAFLSYAQPVADNATIPVSVTLNSILRLNVTAGGNIEFAVNTLRQYTDGVVNSAGTTTKFTVASSIDFDVEMYSESAALLGTDLSAGTNTMNLNNIGYCISVLGTGVEGTAWTIPAIDADAAAPWIPEALLLSTAGTEIITGLATASAGDIAKNSFAIHWELTTADVLALSGGGTLLSQNLPSDRYSTNVFLVLRKHD